MDLEAEAIDLNKLHKLAVYSVWKQALYDVSLDHDFSADGASYSRSQMHTIILENLNSALNEAIPYLPIYEIDVAEITVDNDPYDFYEDRDNLGNF